MNLFTILHCIFTSILFGRVWWLTHEKNKAKFAALSPEEKAREFVLQAIESGNIPDDDISYSLAYKSALEFLTSEKGAK